MLSVRFASAFEGTGLRPVPFFFATVTMHMGAQCIYGSHFQ